MAESLEASRYTPVFDKLRDFAGKRPDFVALYVFGSYATGRAKKGSDVDVAVMTRSHVDGMRRMELETAMSNAVGPDVHLVVFAQAGVLLQRQIMKYGKRIYEADRLERVRQETWARREYLDTRWLYKKIGASANG